MSQTSRAITAAPKGVSLLTGLLAAAVFFGAPVAWAQTSVTNTATVSYPTDPTPGNNTASDTDTVTARKLTLTKVWSNALAGNAVSLTISAGAGDINAAVAGSSTAPSTTSNATADAKVGATITLTEAFTVGSAANYTTTLTCTKVTGGAAVTVTGSGLSRTIVMPSDSDVTCTYTNTRKSATVVIQKTWVNAIINDRVNITATGLNLLNSAANAANETDAQIAQTVYAGDAITFAESFTTGSAANYTTTLACTGTTGLSGSTLTVGSADTAIVCTFTNTRKSATVVIQKTWVNAIINDRVNITATGLNLLNSAANAANETDAQIAQTVYAGDAITFAESFTTGSAANYTTTLACTGTTGLSGSTLTVGSADTAIVCTYTNTRKSATVVVRKTWVNAIINDGVNITVNGSLSLNSNANLANETDTQTAVTYYAGDVLTFAETFTTGSAANYTTTLACTGTTGLSGSTLTVGSADTAIVCTYTNTRKSATVVVRKTWVNAIINDGVNITVNGSLSLNSNANLANETDTQTAVTYYAGDVLTFAESFTSGSAANYTTTLACTGTSGLSGSTLTVGSADTAIVCTYTNTRKSATVVVRKTWVNAIINDGVNITVNGSLSLNSNANLANETDTQTAVTYYAGDVLTFAETFTTGSAANYTTTLACTGTTGLSGSTLTVGSADTAIVCTYTNTRKSATVVVRKTWVNAIINDGVNITVNGSLSLNSNANLANETDTQTAVTYYAGDVLTFAESFTSGSAANYTTTLACTGTSGLSGSTLTVGSADTAIVCTYTNTRKSATVVVRKTWVNAIINDGVNITVNGSLSLNSNANLANETDTQTAVTYYAGDVLTFAETFTTGSAANYTTTLACTGTTGLSGSTLTVGSADTAIVCTYTNTRKSATVTLEKVWVNATVNDAVTVSATGLTDLLSTASAANETDTGSAQTVGAGDVLVLTETFAGGIGISYTSALACTGTSGLSGNTLTIGSNDTAIVCTFTNTHKTRTLTVRKVLSPTTDGGLFNLQINGTTEASDVGHNGSASVSARVDDEYTVAELAGTGTDLANYTSVLSCTGVAGVTGSTSGTFTMPDADVTCTFTNTRKTATVTLRKVWVNAEVNDEVTVSATGLNDLVSTAETASETDTGGAQTVNAGAVLTLSESFNIGSAANYTTTLACTGTTGLSGSTLTVGSADTAIVCTYTNTFNPDPALTIDKTAGTPTGNTAGSTIAYSFVVANTGNVTLTGIAVNDSKLLTAPSCPVSTLAPGASTTCTGSYTITQADVDAGVVNNSATATGTPPTGGPTTSAPDTTSTPLTQSPSQTVVKTLTNDSTGGSVALGDVLTYTVTMTNTGNTTLTGVVVSDSLITPNSTTCATVAPAATCVLTGTYTVTQADVNAGSISNTGTVTSPLCPAGGAGVCTTTIVTPVPQAPALTIEKTAGTPTGNTAGSTIAYSFVVANTGNVTLTGIAVNDSKLLTAPSCPVSTLAPGASTTCTGSYTITQADVDAGVVNNSATATGTPPTGGPTTSAPDTTSTPLTQSPSQTVVKTLTNDSTGGSVALGDVLTYTVTMTNTGNTTLTGVVVSDSLITPNSTTCATVAPAATCVLTGTYTVTQADVNAGSISNTGTVTSPLCPAGGAGVCTTTIVTPVPQAPALTIDKVAGTPTGNTAGSTIAYSFVVANTGNVTLTGIAVNDSKLLTAPSCPVSTLAPGASTTCTGSYTITQADVDAGVVNNSATATGTPPTGGPTTSAPDTTSTPLTQSPSQTVVKTLTNDSTGGSVALGDVLTYTVTMTNTGNTTLTGVVVSDSLITPNSTTCATVAPAATCVLTGTYTVTQADVNAGSISNTGTVTSPLCPAGGAGVCTTTIVTPVPQAPALTIEKTAGTPTGNTVGSTIAYSFVVANTGNVTLTNIVVNDAQLDGAASCTALTLAPGANTTCTGTHTITQAEVDAGVVNNSATATGTPPTGGPTTSAPDTTSTPLTQNPALTIEKTAGTPNGSSLAYSFLVTNTGNVTLTGIVVNDDKLAVAPVCLATTLAPGANTTCTGTHTITQAEVDAGVVNNTATASGTPPGGGTTTSPPDSTSTPVTGFAELSIDKASTTTAIATVGQVVPYTYMVTNTGTITINSLSVTDDKIATVSCPVSTLAPAASTTCTGSYTVTQADLDAGDVTNIATATGTPVSGTLAPATDTVTINATVTPALTIDKVAGTPTGNTAGSTIAYSFVVANTGNVTLTGIAVNDSKLLTAPSCPVSTLAPGASTTCTGSYTITQADVDAGVVNNSATATGTPPTGGPTTSAPDTTSTPLTQSPSQTVVKTLTNDSTGGSVALGDVLTYTVTMTNTGNTTLTGVVVSDSLITPNSTTCATVAPAATCVLTGTYTVTQADVNAGSISNTGTVTSPLCPAGGAGVCTTTIVTPVPQAPALTIDKVAGTPTGNTAGSTIAYSFVVANTGNVTLTGIAVNDSKLLTAPSCPVSTLAPGASTTCTGSYTITQADVDAGVVNNSATATGTPPTGGPTTSAPDTTSTPLTQSPSQTVVKTLTNDSTGGSVALGDVLTYTVTMTNTGNTTLTGVVVSDSLITPNSTTCATVAPAATCVLTGTYTVTQADVNAGSISNTGTVTSPLCPAGGAGVCTTTIVTPVPQTPSQTVVKTLTNDSTGGSVALGDVLTYTVTMTNTGNTTLTGVVVSDSLITPNSTTCATVAPAATCVLTGTYTVTQADVNAGSISNTGTVTSPLCPAGGAGVCTTTIVTPVPQAPALTIDKVAGTPTGNTAGSTIAYSFVVANTGNVTLTGIAVNDSKLLTAPSCPVSTLAPGASTTCTGSYTITQADVDAGVVNNSATATGTPPTGGPTTSAPDTTSTPINGVASISLDKATISPGLGAAGQVVPYTYLVTNTGTITINNLSVTDDKIATVSCPVSTLNPGQSTTCTASYTVTQADMDAGSLTNIATATGTPVSGTLTPATDTVTITLIPSPLPPLNIDKTAGTPTGNTAGSTIAYSFLVTNTGNRTLTNIVVNDAQLDAAASCLVMTLAPGASTTCTGTHTITQAEVNAGVVNNTATATGTPPTGVPVTSPPDSTSTPISPNPVISVTDAIAPEGSNLVHTATLSGPTVFPSTYPFSLTGVTATPGDDFTAITPTFSNGVTLSGGFIVVPAGVSSFTITYPALIDNVNDDGETTTLTIGGVSGTGTILDPSIPELRIVKQVNTRQATIGGMVQYSITITNTGNAPAINFDIIDTPPQGFSYVPGSAVFQDGDNAGTSSGTGPVTFSGLDVAVGQTATIRYLMRVSAGLPSGDYVNRARAFKDGDPISNEATASVRLDKGTDPLFEQSRIWGKVWDDRNGDGWQDADEKGIPGVRLATVEGLVAETDAKGRYHFEGLTLSNMQRGQNFVVKVDVSTLPEGSTMTTENPLLRRITPAVPVRFDFGVKLPPQVAPEALPVIAPVPNEPVRLGAVFFDTDKTTIKPEYMAMLREVAVRIENGGTSTVLLTGFADKRASVAYNLDLARRRAQAVYEEIARQLSPEAKSRLRVELDSAEPATGAQP